MNQERFCFVFLFEKKKAKEPGCVDIMKIHKRIILFLQAHRETDRFFAASGVLSAQSDRGFYHYRRALSLTS
jgi:hypothetical protein